MRNHQADWESWLDSYQRAHSSLPGPVEEECPDCGSRSVKLVYVGPPGLGAASAHYWCDACRRGVVLCRCPVPEGARFVPFGGPHAPGSERPPHFTLVPPV